MPDRLKLLQTLARIATWIVLVGLVVVTVAPLGLRPHSGFSPQVERFLAFALAGGLLALAYPRRPWLGPVLVVGLAIGLELAQHLAVTRHPGVPDMLAKLAGGVAGLICGWIVNLLAGIRPRRSP